MNISKRQKYLGQSTGSNVKSSQSINIDLDLSTLNLFCSFIVSNNKNIKRSHIINLRNLFEILNVSNYKDEERIKRIEFIRRGIEGRLDKNLTDSFMLLTHINGGFGEGYIVDPANFQDMSNSEIEWVNGMVANTLNNAFVFNAVDSLIEAAMAFKSADYKHRNVYAELLRNEVTKLHTEFRRNDARASADTMFSLSADRFEPCIRQFHEEISNPSRKLRTGMVAWNEMLNGGFEGQRVYSIFGLPSEGKSTTLLDLAIQLKKYNKDYVTKDPTKRPCVVLLTMENGERETIERMWAMLTDKAEMSHYTVEEVIEILKADGELYISDDNPVDIIIKYVPGDSVDTGYLYTLTEDLEDEGYEVIAMVQDYLKRIRPVYNSNAEVRIQYGSIINEFKVFAVLKDIPVITASQLNREATKHIDEGRKTNKTDLIRLFGRSNIGESQLILENIDAAYFIVPEYDQDGNRYLGIQKVKSRFYSMIEAFYQPYTDYSPIKFVEDVNLKAPAYKLTMKPEIQNTSQFAQSQINIKPYSDISMLDDGTANIFNMSAYSAKSAGAANVSNIYTNIIYLNKPFMKEDIPLKVPFIKQA